VKAYGTLYALDATDGTEVWSYEGNRVSNVVVSDGTVYTTQSGSVIAYEDGDELWSHEVETTNPHIRGAVHGNVYFVEGENLCALEATDGDRRWSKVVGEDFPVAFDDGTVYAGVNDLRAFSPSGEQLWNIGFEEKLDGVTSGQEYVYGVTEGAVHRIDDGEVFGSWGVPNGNVRSHILNESKVYPGTDEGVYALRFE